MEAAAQLVSPLQDKDVQERCGSVVTLVRVSAFHSETFRGEATEDPPPWLVEVCLPPQFVAGTGLLAGPSSGQQADHSTSSMHDVASQHSAAGCLELHPSQRAPLVCRRWQQSSGSAQA